MEERIEEPRRTSLARKAESPSREEDRMAVAKAAVLARTGVINLE
jgi:hypothetical protein